jgi:hypothetical protein
MGKSLIVICMASVMLLMISTSCTDKPKSLNPNGDSELALLMREMYDDGMKTKQQLLDGKEPEVHVKYKQIHTAKSTESLHVDPTNFSPYALAYEAAMDSFIAAEASSKVAAYQTMVNACMNCHQTVCPGPKVKIRHLYFSEAELASLETGK